MRIFLTLLLLVIPTVAFAQNGQFVPLTNLPGINEVVSSNNLAGLLSQIYKLCIGAAAVLAVLQLVRAGIMYMGGDSITEKKEARELIALSIAGLILVLSPVIVFSIINPEILKLDLTKSLNTLNTSVAPPVTGSLGEAPTGSTIITTSSAAECTQKGGVASAGDGTTFVCALPPGSEAAAYGTCANYTAISAVPQSSSCKPSGEDGAYINISNSCCTNLQSGYKCCGVQKTN